MKKKTSWALIINLSNVPFFHRFWPVSKFIFLSPEITTFGMLKPNLLCLYDLSIFIISPQNYDIQQLFSFH